MSEINQTTNVNNVPGNNKPKKKKKHIFLKVLLGILIFFVSVIGATIGTVKLCKHLGEKQIEKLPTYPFVFEGENTPNYVVDDFKVQNSYEIKGKTVNTTWKSSSSLVEIDSDGNATVTRPENISGTVTLTETYKKFLVKGTRTFDIELISSSSIKEEDVEVIDLESVKNDTYPFPMQILLKDDGNIDFAYGEFDNLYAYTKEDAIAIANAYRELLGIPEEVSFYVDKVVGNDLRTYNLQMYTGDIVLVNQIVTIVVDEDYRVVKINNGYSFSDEEFEQIKNIDKASFDETLFDYMSSKTSEEYVFALNGVAKRNDTACLDYLVLFGFFDGYDIYVDINENKVIEDSSLIMTLNPSDFTKASGLSGKDEFGGRLRFSGSQSEIPDFGGVRNYVLYDQDRNISVYEHENSLWEDVKNGKSLTRRNSQAMEVNIPEETYKDLGMPKGVTDVLLDMTGLLKGRLVYSGTKSFNGDAFNYPVANEAYTNFQTIYDFYYKNLGYYSFDGNGAPIIILTEMDDDVDDACFTTLNIMFGVNKKDRYTTTFASCPDALAHEYMHAVFYANSRVGKGGKEYCSINEGFADVFGLIMAQKETGKRGWSIGEMKCNNGSDELVRDIKNYNNYKAAGGKKFPQKYHGDNWEPVSKSDYDAHINSVLISHIAYEMSVSEYFTTDDVLKVYITASQLGFSSNATFVNARRNILQAIDQKGFSAEAYNFVAKQFDKEEIFDDTFVEKDVPEKNGFKNPNFLYTAGNAIDGDLLWDNNEKREYIAAYSILGSIFGDAKIYIITKSTGASQEEIDKASQTLTETFNGRLLSETEFFKNKTIELEYVEYPSFTYQVAKKFLLLSQKQMRDKAASVFNDNASSTVQKILDVVMSLIFRVDIAEETPYHFFSQLMDME
jgi:Zn-dependent metalloprotease